MKIPLMILSDNPSGVTGLGRIARDLAMRIHSGLPDVFRVGTAGIGGNHSSKLPFANYPITQLQNQIPCDLERIWRDFAGDEQGIILVIMNLSWVSWLAQPERLPTWHPIRDFLVKEPAKPDSLSVEQWNKLNPQMKKVIGKSEKAPFKKWLYCPVDGDLPNGTLGLEAAPVLAGFDRVLAYTRYGAKVLENTLALSGIRKSIPDLPHGIDTSVFYPRDRKTARETLISRLSAGKQNMPIQDDVILLGVIATNSYRKDWALAFETAEELVKRGKQVFMWCHSNDLQGLSPNSYWNLLSLAQNFGMGNRVILTTDNLSEDDMAWCLSALDVGLHIGTGEGYGYFGPDCLACGVPVVHGNYAGGAELLPPWMLVEPKGHRLEGKWMIRRPSFKATDWADRIEYALSPEGKALAILPEYIKWDNAWSPWRQWLLEGIGGVEMQKVLQAAPVHGSDCGNSAADSGD